MGYDFMALAAELKAADEQAIARIDVEKAAGPLLPTIFLGALDCLEELGAPDQSWPIWGPLLSVLLGVSALPTRAKHAGLIEQIAGFIVQKDPKAGFHTTGILLSLVENGDHWPMGMIAASLSASKATGGRPVLEPFGAIEMLALVGHEGLADLLLPLASRHSNRFASAAVLALVRCGVADVQETLLMHLDKRPRLEIVEAAGVMRCKDAVPALLDVAQPDSIHRKRHAPETGPYWVPTVARSLVQIMGEEAVEPLNNLFSSLDDDGDDRVVVAHWLAELGHAEGARYLDNQMNSWMERSPSWGWEPLEAKWETANSLARRGDHRGEMLIRLWYGYHDKYAKFTPHTRGAADRYRYLQNLGRIGNSSHRLFLEWVKTTDFQQSEKGWAMAVEAERALRRIEQRELRISRLCVR